MWPRGIFNDIGILQNAATIHQDNTGSIVQADNDEAKQLSRCKQMEVWNHYAIRLMSNASLKLVQFISNNLLAETLAELLAYDNFMNELNTTVMMNTLTFQ